MWCHQKCHIINKEKDFYAFKGGPARAAKSKIHPTCCDHNCRRVCNLSFLCLCLSHSCTQIGKHINCSHKTLQPESLRFVLWSTGLEFAAAAKAMDRSSSVSPCSTNESAHGTQALSLAPSGEGFIQHWVFGGVCTRSTGHKQRCPRGSSAFGGASRSTMLSM